MQIWCTEGSDQRVCGNHGSGEGGTVFPRCNACCSPLMAMATDSSPEYLLMRMIKWKKWMVVFLINTKNGAKKPSNKVDLVWEIAWHCYWYVKFFAPVRNVNTTAFSTETQFISRWLLLIKPDSWMFWCKSVIRGFWKKAKKLCAHSPYNYKHRLNFCRTAELCVLKFNMSNTN